MYLLPPHLLEPDVEVKGDGFSGTADGWDRILNILGCCTRDQLYCVRPRIVSDLSGTQTKA